MMRSARRCPNCRCNFTNCFESSRFKRFKTTRASSPNDTEELLGSVDACEEANFAASGSCAEVPFGEFSGTFQETSPWAENKNTNIINTTISTCTFEIALLRSICGYLQKSAKLREFLAQATGLCDLFASGAICQEAFKGAT